MININADLAAMFANEVMATAANRVGELEGISSEVAEVRRRIGQDAKEYWSKEAATHLNTTRSRYQKQLYVAEAFGEGVRVGLGENDKLVTLLEEGTDGYNMRPGLLKGAKSRVIPMADGEFRTVGVHQSKDMWQYPRKAGLNLVEATDAYIDDVLIPKYIEILLSKYL